MSVKKNALISLLSIVFLWVAWLIAYFIVRNDYILPSFWDTFARIGNLLIDGAFWRAFGNTLLRTLLAFSVSMVLGIALALLARKAGMLRAFLAPIVSVLRTVPTMAVILVLLLWTSPLAAPVIVSVFVLFPAVYAAVLSALDEVEAEYGELVRVYKVNVRRQIFKLYLPLSAPSVLGQAGSILSMGLKITVSGEVLASTYRSIGGMMQEAKMFVEMPTLLALTVLTVFLGFVLEGLFVLLKKPLLRWRL